MVRPSIEIPRVSAKMDSKWTPKYRNSSGLGENGWRKRADNLVFIQDLFFYRNPARNLYFAGGKRMQKLTFMAREFVFSTK